MKPSSIFVLLISGLSHYVFGAPDVIYQVPVRSDQNPLNRGNYFRASLAVRSDAPDDDSDPAETLKTNAITYDNKPSFLSLRRVALNTSSLIGFGPVRYTTTPKPAKVNQISAEIDKSSEVSTDDTTPSKEKDEGPFIPQVAPPSFRPTPGPFREQYGPQDFPDMSKWTQQTGGNIQQIPDLSVASQSQTAEPVITGDLQNVPQEYNEQSPSQYVPPVQPEAITSDMYSQYQPQPAQQVPGQGPEGRVAQINFVPAPFTEAPSTDTFNAANFQQSLPLGSIPAAFPNPQNIPTQQIPFNNFASQLPGRFPQQPRPQQPTFLPQQDANSFFGQQQQPGRPQFAPQGQSAQSQFDFPQQQQGNMPSQQFVSNGLTNPQGQFVGFSQGQQLDEIPNAGILPAKPAQGPQPGFQPAPGARQDSQAAQAGQVELQSHQPNLNAADPFAQTENQFLSDNNPFQAPNLQNIGFQPQPGQQFSQGPPQTAASTFQAQPAPTFGPQGQQSNVFQQIPLPQNQFNQFLTPEQRQQAGAAQSTGTFQDPSQPQFNPFENSQFQQPQQLQQIPQQFNQFGAQPNNYLPDQQYSNVPPGAFPQDARSLPSQFTPQNNAPDGMFIPPQPAIITDQAQIPSPVLTGQPSTTSNGSTAEAQPRAFDDVPLGAQPAQGRQYGAQPSYGGATGPAGYSPGSSYGSRGGPGAYGGGRGAGGYSPYLGGTAGGTGFGYPSGGSPYPYGAYGGFGYGYRPYYLGYNYDLAPYGIPTAQDFALYGKNTLHPEKSYYSKGQGYGAQAQGSSGSGGSYAGGGYGKSDTAYDTPYGKSAAATGSTS